MIIKKIYLIILHNNKVLMLFDEKEKKPWHFPYITTSHWNEDADLIFTEKFNIKNPNSKLLFKNSRTKDNTLLETFCYLITIAEAIAIQGKHEWKDLSELEKEIALLHNLKETNVEI